MGGLSNALQREPLFGGNISASLLPALALTTWPAFFFERPARRGVQSETNNYLEFFGGGDGKPLETFSTSPGRRRRSPRKFSAPALVGVFCADST
jgi:hypothetical protein